MKKTNILYWVFTILFIISMVMTAIPEVLNIDNGKFMATLGYPAYMNMFLGVAKLLGIIAILIPGFPRLKEWAYAGFFFDLVGAAFSCVAAGLRTTGRVDPGTFFMSIWFILFFAAYFFYLKKLRESSVHS